MKKKTIKKKVASKTSKSKSKVAKKATKKTSKVAKKKTVSKPKAKATKKAAKSVKSVFSKPKATPNKSLIQQKSQAQISPKQQTDEKYQSFYSKYQTYNDSQKQNNPTQTSPYQPKPDIQQKPQVSQNYANKPKPESQTLGQRNPAFFKDAFQKTSLVDQSQQNNLSQGSINKPAPNYNKDLSKKGLN